MSSRAMDPDELRRQIKRTDPPSEPAGAVLARLRSRGLRVELAGSYARVVGAGVTRQDQLDVTLVEPDLLELLVATPCGLCGDRRRWRVNGRPVCRGCLAGGRIR